MPEEEASLTLPSVTSGTEVDPSVYRAMYKSVPLFFTAHTETDDDDNDVTVIDRIIFPDDTDGPYIETANDYLLTVHKVDAGRAIRLIQRAHKERKARLVMQQASRREKKAKAKAVRERAAEKEAAAKAKGN